MKKTFKVVAAFAAASMLLAGCASEPAAETPTFPEGSTMAALASKGEIVIGTKFDQPLFGLKGLSGDPEGFDVEIGKLIAKELGVTPKFVETVSANRETFIQQGNVDIVIATYTINDKRKEVIEFAGPYYMAGQSILALKDRTDLSTPESLVGQPVCSVTGSTPAAKLEEIGAEPVLFGTYTECLEPLRQGTVVAVSTDNVILAGFAAQYPEEFAVMGVPFTEEPYGIGLKKGDIEFRDWINDLLEKSYADGSYKAAWDATAGTVLPFVDGPTPNRY